MPGISWTCRMRTFPWLVFTCPLALINVSQELSGLSGFCESFQCITEAEGGRSPWTAVSVSLLTGPEAGGGASVPFLSRSPAGRLVSSRPCRTSSDPGTFC